MKSSTKDNFTCVLAEFVGTAILVFLGCMGCTWGTDSSPVKVSLSFGLAVMAIVQCFGCVSGSHLSPSVTLAAYILDIISPILALGYFFAQMLGCLAGYALLMYTLPVTFLTVPEAENEFCVTVPHPDVSPLQAVFIEFSITATLILFSCSIWDPRNAKLKETLPIRFFLAILCLALTAGKFTGASMNPARSFAPALWNHNFENQWIYWFGPLSAAPIVAYCYKYIFWRDVAHEISSKE